MLFRVTRRAGPAAARRIPGSHPQKNISGITGCTNDTRRESPRLLGTTTSTARPSTRRKDASSSRKRQSGENPVGKTPRRPRLRIPLGASVSAAIATRPGIPRRRAAWLERPARVRAADSVRAGGMFPRRPGSQSPAWWEDGFETRGARFAAFSTGFAELVLADTAGTRSGPRGWRWLPWVVGGWKSFLRAQKRKTGAQ